ncbi:MAG: hypothetical protein ABW073_01110 [Acidimicrobiia bacterium]
MNVVVTDAALDDLRRLGPALARRAVAQLALLEREADDVDDSPLETGELVPGSGYRKFVGNAGTWRVVFTTHDDIVTVWEVWVEGIRSTGAAFADALHGMQSADTPEAVEHARLLERLGRITGTVPVPRHRVREPVPDWLADALVERAGLTRLDVAAMDASTAFEQWNSRAP